MEEIWRDIPGYEDEYQASTLGRIKSLSRKVRGKSRTGNWFMRSVPERVLKPGKYCKSGHVSVVLRKGSNGKPVHQLIALTFLGPTPNGKEILHINGNPKDNRVENLRFGTRTENILDVYKQNKKWRKVGIKDVMDIRQRLANGEKGSEIAQRYKISQTTVSRIKHRKTFWWLN